MSPNQLKDMVSGITPTLRVFHVGGRGGSMGPVEHLLQLGESLSLSLFEANIEAEDSSWNACEKIITDYKKHYGVKLSVIPRCLSNCVGKKEFHINVMPDCSSLIKMSPDTKNYQRMACSNYRIIWGEICQPKRTVEIDVTTLDDLYANGVVPMPHFLSLDAQGVEYNILEGASKSLQGDLLGVVSEVEFRELYENQKLFMDQYNLLKQHQFVLFELYNSEYWYSGPILGKGALTVAEALFLRDFRYFINKDKGAVSLLPKLSKLAMVAYCFDRNSYAFEILEYIMNNWKHEWTIFMEKNDSRYLHDLEEFYRDVKALQPKMEKVPTYLEFMSRAPDCLQNDKSALGLASRVALIRETLRKDARLILSTLWRDFKLIAANCLPVPIKNLIKKTLLKSDISR